MTSIRDVLLALPFVVMKRLNGGEGYFAAGRMFALLSAETLLLRWPEAGAGAVVDAEVGRAILHPGVPGPLAWVELPVGSADRELRYRIAAAHEGVRAASRRARRERSA